ncbi:antitoxin VapB family protein [Candidatus Woesearchaeota archaeon]|nr:antitoxin VapB family protein [Candidatus Woesearchaeota archaeon]
MATKTISITEDAYERLKSRKKGNESFSDVINKITAQRSLLELAGRLSSDEARAVEEQIQHAREKTNKRIRSSILVGEQ